MKIYTSNQEQLWLKLQSQRCVNTVLRGLNSNCCYNGTYPPAPILKHPPMGNTQLPICNCDKTVGKWGFLGHLHVHQSTVIKNIFLIFLTLIPRLCYVEKFVLTILLQSCHQIPPPLQHDNYDSRLMTFLLTVLFLAYQIILMCQE